MCKQHCCASRRIFSRTGNPTAQWIRELESLGGEAGSERQEEKLVRQVVLAETVEMVKIGELVVQHVDVVNRMEVRRFDVPVAMQHPASTRRCWMLFRDSFSIERFAWSHYPYRAEHILRHGQLEKTSGWNM